MAKQKISTLRTDLKNGDTIGTQLEQTVQVDDLSLPSPQELRDYQSINPDIVKLLIEQSRKEQEHRHYSDREKLKILRHSETRNFRINWWGMFFAFLSLLAMILFSAYALYLDRPWMAGIFGSVTIITIISLFVNSGDKK